jgi:hypothetical protein
MPHRFPFTALYIVSCYVNGGMSTGMGPPEARSSWCFFACVSNLDASMPRLGWKKLLVSVRRAFFIVMNRFFIPVP